MTVIDTTIGDLFTVRVIKHLTTSPLNRWANSYELKATESGSSAELLLAAGAISRFEKAIHMNYVQFDRCIVSTWEPDSVPYDPTSFLVVPLVGVGSVGMVGDPLPLNQCLQVTRQPSYGRFGHVFYRGVLNEADTEAPAGRTVLVDQDGTNDTIQAAITSSGIDDYLGMVPEEALSIVMVNADGSQVRNVLGLFATGVSTVPTDHVWFNRTPPS